MLLTSLLSTFSSLSRSIFLESRALLHVSAHPYLLAQAAARHLLDRRDDAGRRDGVQPVLPLRRDARVAGAQEEGSRLHGRAYSNQHGLAIAAAISGLVPQSVGACLLSANEEQHSCTFIDNPRAVAVISPRLQRRCQTRATTVRRQQTKNRSAAPTQSSPAVAAQAFPHGPPALHGPRSPPTAAASRDRNPTSPPRVPAAVPSRTPL